MAKKTSKRLRHQKIALAIGLTLIAGLAGWMLSVIVIEAPKGEFQEDVHYRLIENPRRIRGDRIEVIEFFSYGCVHCYNFDPDINDWVRDNGDQVRFVRSPLFSSEPWEVMARAYYSMEELGITGRNHYPFFVQIHGVRKNLSEADDIAQWIDGKGTTADAFSRMFSSAVVSNRLRQADRLQRRFKVRSVPTLAVNGKYLIESNRNVGPSRMLEVLDYLIEKELAEKEQQSIKKKQQKMTDTQTGGA